MSASTDSRLDTHTGDTARLTVPVDKDIQPTAEIDLRREFESSGVHAVLEELDRSLIGLKPVKRRIRETAALLLEPVPKGLSDWGTRDSKGLFRPSWSERCGPQPLAGSIVARDFDMKRI